MQCDGDGWCSSVMGMDGAGGARGVAGVSGWIGSASYSEGEWWTY